MSAKPTGAGRSPGEIPLAAVGTPAIAEVVQRMMLQTYAPAAVVTNRQLAPLYFFGPADSYFRIVHGEPGQDLLTMAREGLRPKLRMAIAHAFRTRRPASEHAAPLKRGRKLDRVTIDARPIPGEADDLVLVSFIDEAQNTNKVAATQAQAPGDGARSKQLRRPLAAAMSLNHEFLSANRALGSSQEALQSPNDELTTVNQQLRRALERQTQVAADFSNLLNSSTVATILLDGELRIKIFNPRMRELFALIDSDVGRPLADLVPKFADPELLAAAEAARSGRKAADREVRAESGAWYLRSAVPVLTEAGEGAGVVVNFTDITELKQAEQLAASARRYAGVIVDAATEPMAAVDDAFRLVTANQAFLAEFDLRRDQVGEVTLRELERTVLSHPPLLNLIAQLHAGRLTSTQSELEVDSPGGEKHTWSAKLRSFQSSPQEPMLALLVLANITDQKRIVRRQLQFLIDALPEATVVVDQQARIRFVNTATERLFGYAATELLGQTVDMFVPLDVRQRHSALQHGFIAGPTARLMGTGREVCGISKDGAAIPLEVSLSPLVTADGPLVAAVIHDLRELKKGEAERDGLRRSLAQELADMERLHDLATRLIGVGELHAVLEEILSTTMELQKAELGNIQLYDPVSATLEIAVHKGFPTAFLEHFATARAGDGSVCGRALEARARIVIEDVCSDEAFAPHREIAAKVGFRAVQSTPILARDGLIMGMLSTHFREPHRSSERDLRMTDVYLRIAAELIERAQAEETVEAARRAAVGANQAKSRFLAAASHDLRQPLQAIGLLQGVLQRHVASPQGRACLARLEDAVGEMTELVNTLLDVNQIESGALRVEPADMSVAALFARVIEAFTPVAAVKGLALKCVPSSAIIKGDQRLMRRILGNLLSNAIKYTDKGGILLGCRRRGSCLRIEVWDTGVGIAPENLHTLFDEFYRAEDVRRDQFGLGLGLYIVKRFADLLGFQVEVRSTPGKGTMFAVVVPNRSLAAPARRPGGATEAAGSEPSILLVEDDAAQRDALKFLLEGEGYQVIAAPAGAEAVSALHRQPGARPSVVVADYNLPGAMTGIELIRRVRDEVSGEVHALVLSGQKPPVEPASAEAGGFLFLRKPARPGDVLAAVRTLMARAQPDWTVSDVARRPAVAGGSKTDLDSEIAVIDDEPGVLEAVQATLGADGLKVSTYASGEAFLADAGHDRFRCVMADVGLAGMGGLELQERLRDEGCGARMIFLTGSADLPLAVRAMREGAVDFLQKPVGGDVLRESVRQALEQEDRTGPDPPRRDEAAARLRTLTAREREVMDRIVMGELNKNIAADLGVSERTIEHHRQSIMRKLDVKSVAMLVRLVG